MRTPSVIRLLSGAGNRLADVVFPPICIVCGGEGVFLCPACSPPLPRLHPPFCMYCGEPLPSGRICRNCATAPLAIDSIRSVFPMEGVVRDALHALKYRDTRVLAVLLGHEMATLLQALPAKPSVLVPVPLHRSRLRQRGYNQAALLACALGDASGIPVREDILERHTATAPQARSASRSARLRNVASAFTPHGDLSGETIAVIDDVCTTGATLAACAQALYAAGAEKVYGLTVAREV